MLIALISLVILLVMVPVIASGMICVPKWWEDEIRPHMPEWMASDTKTDISRWYWAPFRWCCWVGRFMIIVVIGIPVAFFIMLCIKYVLAWNVWIERKCPYTAVSVHHEYGSQRRAADRIREDWKGTFKDMWTTATSRFDV